MSGKITIALDFDKKVPWIARKIKGGKDTPSSSDVKKTSPTNELRVPNSITENPEQPLSIKEKWQRGNDFLKEAYDLAKQKKYHEAIEKYTTAINFIPNAPSIYLVRANVKLKLQNYRGAIADYDQAIQFLEAYEKARIARGEKKGGVRMGQVIGTSYINANEIYLAIPRLGEGLGVVVEDLGFVYFQQGDAKNMFGDKIGACDDFRLACNVDNDFCDNSKRLCSFR